MGQYGDHMRQRDEKVRKQITLLLCLKGFHGRQDKVTPHPLATSHPQNSTKKFIRFVYSSYIYIHDAAVCQLFIKLQLRYLWFKYMCDAYFGDLNSKKKLDK